MDPLFRQLTVGVVPVPTQVPPKPFDRDDLQKVFFDVSRDFPYSQFGLLPADQGAQLLNPPGDRVLLQPQLLQVQTPLGSGTTEMTAERAREKATMVLNKAAERLGVRGFLACGIKVICYNFMPIVDWTRTELDRQLAGGGRALRFDVHLFAAFDCFMLKRQGAYTDYSELVKARARASFVGLLLVCSIRINPDACATPSFREPARRNKSSHCSPIKFRLTRSVANRLNAP